MPKVKFSTPTHKLERELIEPVTRYLHEIGCQVVVPELRFFDRGIDIYGVKRTRTKRTFAVELKLVKWQRAIQQAAVYQLCADYSFIALPIQSALNVDLAQFKNCGVGVLTVRQDGSVGCLLNATRSVERRQHYIEAMAKHAEKGAGACPAN
jgi:hypothetical protein